MSDALQTPKCRRTRWLALSLLLVPVACSAGWWFYPRGDARFVGKWKSQSTALGYWDLRSNGIAVWHTGSPTLATAYTTWQVEDNIIRMGQPQSSPHQKWRTWMIHQWNNLPFNKWIADIASFRILEVNADKLVLLSTDIQEEEVSSRWAEAETLVRLPE